MKREVSQYTSGAPDSEKPIQCAPGYLVGHPDILHRESHNERSRAVAPDSLGNGRIQQSTAIDPNGRLTW
jgi:hypothetical protein